MKRRSFIKKGGIAAAGTVALAGCAEPEEEEDESEGFGGGEEEEGEGFGEEEENLGQQPDEFPTNQP